MTTLPDGSPIAVGGVTLADDGSLELARDILCYDAKADSWRVLERLPKRAAQMIAERVGNLLEEEALVRHVAIGVIGAVAMMAGATNGRADEPAKWPGFCSLDAGQPKPCSISDRVTADGQHDLRFSFDGITARFLGRNAGAWWSGKLNGRPAMGYERHRGYTIFSATDLKATFEWCDKLSSADGGGQRRPLKSRAGVTHPRGSGLAFGGATSGFASRLT